MSLKMTIGQYHPGNSAIHMLDPRTKLIAVFGLLTLLFMSDSFVAMGIVFLFLISIISVAKIPIVFVLRGLKGVLFIIIFTALLNIFFVQGQVVIFSFGFITVTMEGVIVAITMAVRLMLLIISSTILTLTTSPIALTAAIENLLGPFKKIKMPVHEISMMMTIALRFIPTLLEEAEKIMKAQMARGASFDTGGIIDRVKSMIPVIVPLFVSSFRRADDLAMSMDARCYRGDINRTKFKELKYNKSDLLALLVMLLLGIVIFFF